MNFIQRNAIALSTLIILLSLSRPLYSADNNCSFATMVTADEYSYRISSNPVESCSKQQLSISVLKNALPFTQYVASSDFMVENAWAEDIDDDGRFELLVVSRRVDESNFKTLDIFSVEGTTLRQARIPELVDRTGYRGGDRFFRDGERLVRTYPLYLSSDVYGNPTGGEKRVLYQYRNHAILLASAPPSPKNLSTSAKTVSARKTELVKIISVQPKQDYIEISTSSSTDRYKVFRISDPWRLVLDFPGAVTDMQDKTILIDRFGISRARIGVNKGNVRVVFDSAVSPLPTETVTPAENAVRIGFYPSK